MGPDILYSYMKRGVCLGTLVVNLAMPVFTIFVGNSAYADEEPFQLDDSHWMSSGHYQDALKSGTLDALMAAPPKPAVVDQPAPAPVSTSAAPTVAVPTRPIDLPVMPGFNKGFDVQVTSTEDDTLGETSTPFLETDKSTDIHLSDREWSTPRKMSGTTKNFKSDDGSDASGTINVRMTFLPDRTITPVSSPSPLSPVKLAHLALEKSIENKSIVAAKTPTQAAVCAAIDTYKKQQLDAIQSDRQTLKALQDAVSSLGLKKELGFITGSNSALSTPGSQSGPSEGMDTPNTTIR